MKSRVFWLVMPCSSGPARHFRGTYRLNLHGWWVTHTRNQQKQLGSWAYYLTMKMEVICSSKTSGCLWTTQRYNPEAHILQSQPWEHKIQWIILLVPYEWCSLSLSRNNIRVKSIIFWGVPKWLDLEEYFRILPNLLGSLPEHSTSHRISSMGNVPGDNA
jgi:hypothetical protein